MSGTAYSFSFANKAVVRVDDEMRKAETAAYTTHPAYELREALEVIRKAAVTLAGVVQVSAGSVDVSVSGTFNSLKTGATKDTVTITVTRNTP